MLLLVRLVICLGMLVIVPLGLTLLRAPSLDVVRCGWPVLAVPGAVSLWLPRGAPAVGLAGVYAAGTGLFAVLAARRLWASRSLRPVEIAALTALVTPAIAGLALVAERGGWQLFGFSLPVLTLTVAHFHFAWGAISVPVGTLIVLTGFFLGDGVELLGAAVLTAGMWLVAWVTWCEVRPRTSDRWNGALLPVSSGILVLSMLLALSWALGGAVGTPKPSLAWMAATHGVANATGFALCGLLAWRRLRTVPV